MLPIILTAVHCPVFVILITFSQDIAETVEILARQPNLETTSSPPTTHPEIKSEIRKDPVIYTTAPIGIRDEPESRSTFVETTTTGFGNEQNIEDPVIYSTAPIETVFTENSEIQDEPELRTIFVETTTTGFGNEKIIEDPRIYTTKTVFTEIPEIQDEQESISSFEGTTTIGFGNREISTTENYDGYGSKK